MSTPIVTTFRGVVFLLPKIFSREVPTPDNVKRDADEITYANDDNNEKRREKSNETARGTTFITHGWSRNNIHCARECLTRDKQISGPSGRNNPRANALIRTYVRLFIILLLLLLSSYV